ncbi:MAG TPA: HAD family hydrolase [Solirubrobacteraceae bacterium]
MVVEPRLVLFDIDGTLVTSRGAGRRAMGQALVETFGATGPLGEYDFRGKTDLRIVRDLMGAAGIAPAQIQARLADCFAAYVRALEEAMATAVIDVMPGIPALLRELAGREDVVLGLLTGNIEAGARVKLGPTGLLPYFRLGAYGSDDADRSCLPPIAAARAERLVGRPFSPDRIVVIGDTPLDVACARACGAVAVAVATGFHPMEDLVACAPDLLFADLADTADVLARLLPAGAPAAPRGD